MLSISGVFGTRDSASCCCSELSAKFKTVGAHAKCYPCKAHANSLLQTDRVGLDPRACGWAGTTHHRNIAFRLALQDFSKLSGVNSRSMSAYRMSSYRSLGDELVVTIGSKRYYIGRPILYTITTTTTKTTTTTTTQRGWCIEAFASILAQLQSQKIASRRWWCVESLFPLASMAGQLRLSRSRGVKHTEADPLSKTTKLR